MRRITKRILGFSLVEMMVSMVIGMVILGSITMLAVGELHSTSDSLLIMRMNQELRAVMGLMVNDIRRADFGQPANNNTYPLVIEDAGATIRFSYDCCSLAVPPAPPSGPVPAAQVTRVPDQIVMVDPLALPDERFGFRLNRSTGIGVLESFRHGDWHPITDPNMTDVTLLQMCFWAPGVDDTSCPLTVPNAAKTNAGAPPYMELRSIRVRLRAQLRGHPDVSRGFTETIKVRSNAFVRGTP